MTKVLLILNAKAATQEGLRDIVTEIQAETALDVFIPWSFEQMEGAIAQALASGATRIIAEGGDGTLNAVVNLICAPSPSATPVSPAAVSKSPPKPGSMMGC